MTGSNRDNGGLENPSAAAETKKHGLAANLVGPAVVVVVFTALAALSWRKWSDAIIDFGTQLYIPWRLNEGAVLYRDLYYFAGGPLSQYFNALLFKIFGVSFTTLIAANLLLSCLLIYFIYRRFLRAADVLTATTICLGIVVVFIFAEYISLGNYNFIAPYSHETVHGILLSLFAITLLSDWLAQPRLWRAFLAGFCAGLVFLTKPDIFMALMASCAATLAIHWLKRGPKNDILKAIMAFGLAMMMPLLFFFGLFLRTEDWRSSLRYVVFGWLPLFQPEVRDNIYYVKFRGMDSPAMYLQQMAVHFLCAAAGIALYAIIFRVLQRWETSAKIRWTVWAILTLPLGYWALTFRWFDCGISLPLWCLAALALLAWQAKQTPAAQKFTFPLLWTVFALVSMSKLGVHVRIWQCGFSLAMPAFVVAVYFLIWLLPGLLETRHRVPARYLRASLVAALLVGFIDLWNNSQKWYDMKHLAIGRGGDKIYSFGPSIDYGEYIKRAVDWVDKNVPADATLAVLPSGINLNYLTRRINPTPCLFWDPNSMAMWGQAAMTSRFEATPPDYIMVVEQDQSEFGVGYLGSSPGYGVELMQWVKTNYREEALYGAEPLRNGHFGVKILKHLSPATDSNSTPIASHLP